MRGVGAGNYDRPYFARRATTEDIRQPHSIELQLLSELGLVGAALFALALAGLALGARRAIAAGRARRRRPHARRRVDRHPRRLAGAHQRGLDPPAARASPRSRSWPRSASCARPGAARARKRAGPRLRWLPALGVALFVTLAAVSLSRQALSEHFVSAARSALGAGSRHRACERPTGRCGSIRRRSGAYYAKAAALARFNEAGAAKAALREAARREPGDYVTWALLGDLAVRTGDFGRGAAPLRARPRAQPARSVAARARARPAKLRCQSPDLRDRDRSGILSACASLAWRGWPRSHRCCSRRPRSAQEDGVFIDPDSPSAKEYQHPARERAAPGRSGPGAERGDRAGRALVADSSAPGS